MDDVAEKVCDGVLLHSGVEFQKMIDSDLLNGYLSKKQRICNIIPKSVYLLVTNF